MRFKEGDVVSIFKAVWTMPQLEFGKGPSAVKEYIGRLADGGFDLILPEAKNRNSLFSYPTDRGVMHPSLKGWDPIGNLIDEAHSHGFKVHPWVCVFPEGEYSLLLKEKPDLVARAKDGSPLQWGCPAKNEVQDFEFSIYEELMRRYPIDGVHMDYIRYMGRNMCYCEECRERFVSRIGKDPVELELKDPVWVDWARWKVGIVSKFVKRLSNAARNQGLEVSAAVFPDYYIALQEVSQDWVDWADKGYVDYLFPMTYTNLLELARALTETHIALVREGVQIWEGLGKSSSASTLTTDMLVAQVKAVIDAGAKGIVIFHSKALRKRDIRALKMLNTL